MTEHALQNEIRNALAGHCLAFRANVGQAWTGDVSRLPDGSVLIRNPRPFSTGLPPGFADLFGMVPVTITPDHVGQQLAQFFALEIKTPTGRVRPEQARFLEAVRRQGGRAEVARSPADALAAIK